MPEALQSLSVRSSWLKQRDSFTFVYLFGPIYLYLQHGTQSFQINCVVAGQLIKKLPSVMENGPISLFTTPAGSYRELNESSAYYHIVACSLVSM